MEQELDAFAASSILRSSAVDQKVNAKCRKVHVIDVDDCLTFIPEKFGSEVFTHVVRTVR